MLDSALRCFVRPIFAIALLMMIYACGAQIDEAVWTEEVMLHDGRMIQVNRRNTRMHGGFPEKRGRLLDYELTYPPLGLLWKGTAELQPVSFELFSDMPYIVFHARSMANCKDPNPKNYAAKFMKWEGGQWIEIPQTAFPTQDALVNLLNSPWGRSTKDDVTGLVSWGQKAMEDGFNADKPITVAHYFERARYRLCGDGDFAKREK